VDPIPNETTAEIMQFDLNGEGGRWICDGAEPFPPNREGVVRFSVAPGDLPPDTEHLRHDSDLRTLMPSVDVDGEDAIEIMLGFFTGSRPVVAVRAKAPIPREEFLFVAGAVVRKLEATEGWGSEYVNLASELKPLARWILEQRTREIEDSVRAALADDQLTDHDYEALRSYPERLAKIEKLGALIVAQEPEVASHKPKPTGIYAPLDVEALDFFSKHLEEAMTDARNAVARLSGLISTQQIVLTQRQGEVTERFQRLITIVGAAVLVPGLVAAVFGTNVDFPGRDSSGAFWAMLALMAGSALASYAAIRLIESGRWRAAAEHSTLKHLLSLSSATRLTLIAAIAVTLIALGIFVLARSERNAAGSSEAQGQTSGEPEAGAKVNSHKDLGSGLTTRP
jgi:CorA-like Mg2+ transporter protein